MKLTSRRRSIRLFGQLAVTCVAFAVWTVMPLQAQSVTETYRAAAQAYRDAANKATASRRPCFLEWAKYYDDYAAAVQRGYGEPRRPALDPGCPATSSGADSSTR
jgi:hypothetical protein